MAYYGYNSYGSGTGEYHSTPYTTSYDVVPYQPSFAYAASEFHEPEFIGYYPNTYNNSYDSSKFEISYSTYSFSEPKLIEYDASNYLSSQTQYLISYSTSEFNVPDFVEYDPTPYDGGYDLALTYGKPLPPSDDICYPRSTEASNGLSPDSFSYGSIPSPYEKVGNNDISEKPIIASKPADVSDGGPKSNGETVDQLSIGDKNGNGNINCGDLVGPIEDSNQGEEKEGYTYTSYDHEYPWCGYGYDYDYGFGNGRKSGWYEGECEKGVSQPTYGYGSDAVDFCESLFGYWPCLSKEKLRRDRRNQGFGSEGSNSNPWNGTADYIFGSPVGYGERRDEGRFCMSSSHGHGSYYHQQPPYYVQEEYDENSWK